MRFKVPRHIEYESKIVYSLTFKQLLYLAGGAVIIFFLYFIIPVFGLFLLLSIIIAGLSLSLAFVNVGTQSFPEYISGLFYFSTSSRTYLWEKKDLPPVFREIKKENHKEGEEGKEDEEVKTKGKSKLGNISTKIETS